MQQPGQVVTTNVLASLVGEAWPCLFTPLNILSGFRKCGIQPFTPGEISDRQLCVSKCVTPPIQQEHELPSQDSPPEKIALFEQRYEEGDDIDDPEYKVWLKLYHTESVCSASSGLRSSSSNCDPLSGILFLPKPPDRTRRQKKSKAVCITEDSEVEEMKDKEREKVAQESARAERKAKNQKERDGTQKAKKGGRKRKEDTRTLTEAFAALSTSDACPVYQEKEEEEEEGIIWVCCEQCDTFILSVSILIKIISLSHLYVWTVCNL